MLFFGQFANSTYYNIIQCIKNGIVLPEAKHKTYRLQPITFMVEKA